MTQATNSKQINKIISQTENLYLDLQATQITLLNFIKSYLKDKTNATDLAYLTLLLKKVTPFKVILRELNNDKNKDVNSQLIQIVYRTLVKLVFIATGYLNEQKPQKGPFLGWRTKNWGKQPKNIFVKKMLEKLTELDEKYDTNVNLLAVYSKNIDLFSQFTNSSKIDNALIYFRHNKALYRALNNNTLIFNDCLGNKSNIDIRIWDKQSNYDHALNNSQSKFADNTRINKMVENIQFLETTLDSNIIVNSLRKKSLPFAQPDYKPDCNSRHWRNIQDLYRILASPKPMDFDCFSKYTIGYSYEDNAQVNTQRLYSNPWVLFMKNQLGAMLNLQEQNKAIYHGLGRQWQRMISRKATQQKKSIQLLTDEEIDQLKMERQAYNEALTKLKNVKVA